MQEDGGFYWLRVAATNETTVGQWLVTSWFVVGTILPLTDDDVTVISKRLIPPDEAATGASG